MAELLTLSISQYTSVMPGRMSPYSLMQEQWNQIKQEPVTEIKPEPVTEIKQEPLAEIKQKPVTELQGSNTLGVCVKSEAISPVKAHIVRPWECSPRRPRSQPNSPVYIQTHIATPYVINIVPIPESVSEPSLSPPYYSPVYVNQSTHLSPSVTQSISPQLSPMSHDSGYLTDPTNSSVHSRESEVPVSPTPTMSRYEQYMAHRASLKSCASHILEAWYENNIDHPYATKDVVDNIAKLGDITPLQVRKWMANKRVRTQNTKRHGLKKSHNRHHPYASGISHRKSPSQQTTNKSPVRQAENQPSSTSTSPLSRPGSPVFNGQAFMTSLGVPVAISPISP